MWRIADGYGTTQRNGSFLHRRTHTSDPKGTFVLLQSGHPAFAIDATQCMGNSIASGSPSRCKRSPHGRLSPYELDALRVFNIFDTDAGSACRAASPVEVVTASARQRTDATFLALAIRQRAIYLSTRQIVRNCESVARPVA
jgi:hypothetical protein